MEANGTRCTLARPIGVILAIACCVLLLRLAQHAAAQDTIVRAAPIVELEADRKPTLVTNGNCLLRNGTIITVTHGVILNGDVLVRNGKIAEIGKNLTVPAGIAIIDAGGKFVTPGIVDAHSHIASDETNEATDSITAEVRIQDVLNPESVSVWRGLSNGVTTSLVLHGSANAIGGQSSVIKMKYRRSVEEMLVADAPRMIKFALGENVKRSGRGFGGAARYPTTRMGVESVYRRAFAEARAYMQVWDRYEAEHRQGRSPVSPRRDLRLEALADVLRGKIWVQCHCYRADEMLMMVRLSQEFGFKIGALQHGLEAYKIAPELAAAHIPVSTFADAWAYKIEAFEAIPFNAAMCLRAGIVTSVNSDSDSGNYRLNLEAAKAIKFGGLSEVEAWKLITINPAMQLGVDHRTGSLEPGKDADIAIWVGNPFTVSSKCVTTLVDGEVLFQRRDAFGVDRTALVRTELPVCPSDHMGLTCPPPARAYAIVGATIHPVSGPVLANGTLIIEGDRIKAVGQRLAIPRGTVVVRARGLQVYPGLIDAGSGLGLDEIGQVPATADNAESGMFQPDLKALTAVNAASVHIAVTRAGGITCSLTRPTSDGGFRGGGSLISGQGALIALDGWTPEQMQIRSPATLHVAFPEFVRPSPGDSQSLPPDFVQKQKEAEKEQLRKLREFFAGAKRYAAARSQGGSVPTAEPQMDAVAPYLAGALPVVFSASTPDGIRHAVDFAAEFGLKPIIQTGPEALKVADVLAKKSVAVIYTLPMSNSSASDPPHEYDPYDSVFAAPGLLHRAGVKVCFASDATAMAKNLPSQVGITRGFGLPEDVALKAITLDAALILGVADRMGSLEAGKLANIIVTDGDPLEITTHLHFLFIAGRAISLENKHTGLYRLYQQRLSGGAAPLVTERSREGTPKRAAGK